MIWPPGSTPFARARCLSFALGDVDRLVKRAVFFLVIKKIIPFGCALVAAFLFSPLGVGPENHRKFLKRFSILLKIKGKLRFDHQHEVRFLLAKSTGRHHQDQDEEHKDHDRSDNIRNGCRPASFTGHLADQPTRRAAFSGEFIPRELNMLKTRSLFDPYHGYKFRYNTVEFIHLMAGRAENRSAWSGPIDSAKTI